MANLKTDAEWEALISEAEKNIIISESPRQTLTNPVQEIPNFIDHTLLKLDATTSQIIELCNEAKQYQFAAVCVRPNHVSQAVSSLSGTSTSVASVIGFHEGTHLVAEKSSEISIALAAGAKELDIVLNREPLLAGSYSDVHAELLALRAAAPAPKTRLKLILETSQLPRSHDVVAACVIAGHAGYDYIKTSTGFCGRGASIEDVRLMSACADYLCKSAVSEKPMKVKASGGVRSLEDAICMIAAGASRIGTSSGVKIMRDILDGR